MWECGRGNVGMRAKYWVLQGNWVFGCKLGERDVAGTSYLYGVQVSEIACRENFSQSLRGFGGPGAWVFQGQQRWKMATKSQEESGKAIEMLRNLSRETISSNIT